MDNIYCLDKDELYLFIENVLYSEQIEDSHLNAVIYNASNWLVESIGLTYFLGRILQKKINNGVLSKDYIDRVYKLKDSLFFDLNEFEANFINYLLLHDRLIKENFTLDEILNFFHSGFIEKDYGRIIRS